MRPFRVVTPAPPPASPPQVMFPLISVSRTKFPLQFKTVPMLIPPAIMDSPPANVEVAVEEELRPPPNWRSFATERVLANVEEAEEKRLVSEESPLTAREEEAEKAPDTLKFCEKVEEAVETSPPLASKKNVLAPDAN